MRLMYFFLSIIIASVCIVLSYACSAYNCKTYKGELSYFELDKLYKNLKELYKINMKLEVNGNCKEISSAEKIFLLGAFARSECVNSSDLPNFLLDFEKDSKKILFDIGCKIEIHINKTYKGYVSLKYCENQKSNSDDYNLFFKYVEVSPRYSIVDFKVYYSPELYNYFIRKTISDIDSCSDNSIKVVEPDKLISFGNFILFSKSKVGLRLVDRRHNIVDMDLDCNFKNALMSALLRTNGISSERLPQYLDCSYWSVFILVDDIPILQITGRDSDSFNILSIDCTESSKNMYNMFEIWNHDFYSAELYNLLMGYFVLFTQRSK